MEWADSVVHEAHLQILEDSGYSALSSRKFSQLGFGPARFLVKVSWQPTWEPEARLCEHAPHQELVDEYRHDNLEWSPTKLQAQNIDEDQCTRLQQGLYAMTRPCNAYHEALKTHLHISLDPINPDFDIIATGSATMQCKNISDCYAKEPRAERPQTLRALAFDNDEKLVSGLGVACMAQQRKQHIGLNGSTLPEATVALLKIYKHGNESDKYSVHNDGHWSQAPGPDSLLRDAFPIEYERFASPLDVHPNTRKHRTPFAADAAFGAKHDFYSTAWRGCSQADPVSDDGTMDMTVRWAMALPSTTQAPVMTLVHVAWRAGSAYTKWLGHPLVHVLLRVKACCNPRGHATKVPTDF